MLSTLPILVILSKEDSCEFITIISQRFGVSVDNPKPWDKFPQAPYMNCGFKTYHKSTLIVKVAMTDYFPLSFKLFPQIIETIPKRWFHQLMRLYLNLKILWPLIDWISFMWACSRWCLASTRGPFFAAFQWFILGLLYWSNFPISKLISSWLCFQYIQNPNH